MSCLSMRHFACTALPDRVRSSYSTSSGGCQGSDLRRLPAARSRIPGKCCAGAKKIETCPWMKGKSQSCIAGDQPLGRSRRRRRAERDECVRSLLEGCLWGIDSPPTRRHLSLSLPRSLKYLRQFLNVYRDQAETTRIFFPDAGELAIARSGQTLDPNAGRWDVNDISSLLFI